MKTEVKQITFSKPMVEQIEKTAKEKGVTFPEFIRHLVISYYENDNHYMTKATEKSAVEAMKDLKNAVSTDDVSKFLKKL